VDDDGAPIHYIFVPIGTTTSDPSQRSGRNWSLLLLSGRSRSARHFDPSVDVATGAGANTNLETAADFLRAWSGLFPLSADAISAPGESVVLVKHPLKRMPSDNTGFDSGAIVVWMLRIIVGRMMDGIASWGADTATDGMAEESQFWDWSQSLPSTMIHREREMQRGWIMVEADKKSVLRR